MDNLFKLDKIENRGGKRDGAGRKPGSRNKTTLNLTRAFQEAVETHVDMDKVVKRVYEIAISEDSKPSEALKATEVLLKHTIYLPSTEVNDKGEVVNRDELMVKLINKVESL